MVRRLFLIWKLLKTSREEKGAVDLFRNKEFMLIEIKAVQSILDNDFHTYREGISN